jgi:hypothetical protein
MPLNVLATIGWDANYLKGFEKKCLYTLLIKHIMKKFIENSGW